MPKYINADALGLGKANRSIFEKPEFADGWNSAIDIISTAPAADVAEVKHGYWKDNNNGTFTCSECGGRASKMDWCGCCGAKMDGKKVE